MKRYHYLVHDDRETDNKAPDPGTAGYHSVTQGQSSSIYTSDATLPVHAVILNESEPAPTKKNKDKSVDNSSTPSSSSSGDTSNPVNSSSGNDVSSYGEKVKTNLQLQTEAIVNPLTSSVDCR